MAECEFEVLPGPGHVMRWGVADRSVHDDMIVSAALVSVLDGMEWSLEVEGEIIPAEDPFPRRGRENHRWTQMNTDGEED